MSSNQLLLQPENPSERYLFMPITFRCDFCGKDFNVWEEFLRHMETTMHSLK